MVVVVVVVVVAVAIAVLVVMVVVVVVVVVVAVYNRRTASIMSCPAMYEQRLSHRNHSCNNDDQNSNNDYIGCYDNEEHAHFMV